MNEKRLIDRLTSYWDMLPKDKGVPEFTRFNHNMVDEVWGSCLVFTVAPTTSGRTAALTFSQIGDQLRPLYGTDMLGKTFNPNQRQFQAGAVIRKMDALAANPVPLVDMGQFVTEGGKIIKYRSCLLPFGHEGLLTHVIAGLSWRAF